jgi:predicted nucleic acid-binding protein
VSRVFWDTNLFIYLIEDYGAFSERVARLRQRMLARGDQLYTSTLTLGEVLVKPLETQNLEFQRAYQAQIEGGAVLIPFDRTAARHYATIRADRTLRAPDAIQLSCAAAAGIDLFITNDDRLSQKIISGVQFVASLDRALL